MLKSLSVFYPSKESLLLKTASIVLASILLAVASQFSFLIPSTPVFVTMQTLAIFFMGRMLGPAQSALAVFVYLVEGAFGLPVFALGQSGLVVLFGPKGGFYLGFMLAAWISGWSYKEPKVFKSMTFFLLANCVVYLVGLSWLSLWVGADQAFLLGFVPFAVGDLLKIAAAGCILKGSQQFINDAGAKK